MRLQKQLVGILSIGIMIFFVSCDGKSKQPSEVDPVISTENVVIKFIKSNQIYCKGQYEVYKRNDSIVRKIRTGIWNFYGLNGDLAGTNEYQNSGEIKNRITYFENEDKSDTVNRLESNNVKSNIEYDFDGSVKNGKSFYRNGKLERSEFNETNTKIVTSYSDEGNIISESVTTSESELDIKRKTTKFYYKNGQVKSEIKLKDEFQTERKMWDEKGTKVLDIDYTGYEGAVIIENKN